MRRGGAIGNGTGRLWTAVHLRREPPVQDYIRILGARVHNLKNISLSIPHNQLTVVTGVSGSGKSSLAVDTIYAQGQRRYVDFLTEDARQFLHPIQKPDVFLI